MCMNQWSDVEVGDNWLMGVYEEKEMSSKMYEWKGT